MSAQEEPEKNASQQCAKLKGFLRKLPKENLAALTFRARWIRTARPEQLTPTGDWRVWLILAGRGWGKTRTGAEDVAAYALWNDNVRVGVIAPTFADARDVCVEGQSGLLRVLPPSCVRAWHRSTGDIVLFNESRIKIYSADQPERLRGPQHHRIWCDEVGAWPTRGAFDQMLFGLRLGDDPRVIITTTPRGTPLVRELVARAGKDVFITRGRTVDNAENLSSVALSQLKERYEGTRLGRQELDAEILDDTEGSLWTRKTIEACRCGQRPKMRRVVVAVDPALSSGPSSDETGIVAVGIGEDGLFYVLADWSCKAPPETWARRAIGLYEEEDAQMIVAEVNAGGALVERLLRQVNGNFFFKPLRAIRGKMERAMPVAALYEQGRVRHVGGMTKLEDQMAAFSPLVIGEKSPDRVDALVWAITELSDMGRMEPKIRRL